MGRCAFLTTKNLEEFFIYDDLVKPHLADLGWQVDDVSWHNKDVDYSQYDVVIVRSTWDYQAYAESFMQTLTHIDSSKTRLENPLALMQWNVSKCYLKDLESKGVAILPTVWLDCFDSKEIQAAFRHFATSEIIIKPLVSANADFTYRLTEEDFLFKQQSIKSDLQNRSIMLQAFEKTILDKGEYSLFYFDGEYSHTINKVPASGDFRVQEEHGGQLESIEPTKAMRSLAQKTLNALPENALYARIDMLETPKGLAIIEVELIEPSLYFNMDEESPKRFAKAIIKRSQV
ncbi:MAG: glutathione synthase/RimK-type ligase-like ATP-grasp enzyme [Alphaproteobacteria bacterium]|jgi:glutathione synthase/RimK-type ligase-like ATP-grasp enzyme